MGTSARDAGLNALGPSFKDTAIASLPLSIVFATPWVICLMIEIVIRVRRRITK